jgi:hypothetical protein
VTDNADVPKEAVAVWEFLPHKATPFMAEAVRVLGRRVLALDEESWTLDIQAAASRPPGPNPRTG